AVVSGNAHTGTYSLRLSSTSDAVYQVISGLQPNTTYTVTGWGKNSVSGDQAALIATNENGVTYGYTIYFGTSFAQQSVTFTTGSNTSIRLYLTKPFGSGASYIDDLFLQSVDTAKNLDFESGNLATWTTAGSPTVSSTSPRNGSYALKLSSTSDS